MKSKLENTIRGAVIGTIVGCILVFCCTAYLLSAGIIAPFDKYVVYSVNGNSVVAIAVILTCAIIGAILLGE